MKNGDENTTPAFWLEHRAKMKRLGIILWNDFISRMKASAHILDVKSYSRYIADFNNEYLEAVDQRDHRETN
jgi:hypothetical protein